MSGVRKALCLVSLCLCLLSGGCSMLTLKSETVPSSPNLNLLSMSPYEDEPAIGGSEGAGGGSLRVDLWLGASRLMGGISAIEESMYPHMSRRYREGGFHYRLENKTGLYNEVLCELLATAEGSFTRILRFGDERLPDGLITGAGLASAGDAEALRSVRRDLLTYSVSPLPSIFDELSTEDMEGGYYDLGTPMLNRMAHFAASGGAELENPGRVADMSALLDAQIAALAAGERDGLTASGDADYPLLYALQNIDLSRLSVITFDPAELRRLSDVSPSGGTTKYIENALRERGIYDKGLTVALYAMTLDYMGQLSSFCAADFAEPLVWGKLSYNSSKQKIVGAMPMPRVMLMLVVGGREDVMGYTAALNARLDSNADLKELRGPARGELEYKANGRTVTQQPFGFSYEYTLFERPALERVTRHTEGVTVTDADGNTASLINGQTTLLIDENEGGDITVSLPLQKPMGGVALDATKLQNALVTVLDSLLLSDKLPNEVDALLPSDAQTIAVRDTVYVYSRLQNPYAGDPTQSPFALKSLKPGADGDSLKAVIAVDGDKLKQGYYRLLLSADITPQQLSWQRIDWIDGAQSLDATLTNAQISEWEAFSALIDQFQRGNPPEQFSHAWGPAVEKSYHGVEYPDFPPVYRVPWLKELASQLRAAANVDATPYARCVFDVFVGN